MESNYKGGPMGHKKSNEKRLLRNSNLILLQIKF